MKVILEGTGRLAIEIIPGSGDARGSRVPWVRWRASRSAPRAGSGELFNADAFGSGEEALFAGITFLLRRYQERTGQAPTHEVLTALVRTVEELLTSGKLPPPGEGDRMFLSMLLVVLEQVVSCHGVRWLDDLIRGVRATIASFDDPDDDDGTNGDGSGDGGLGGAGAGGGGNNAPSGGNGVRSGGSSLSETRGRKKTKK